MINIVLIIIFYFCFFKINIIICFYSDIIFIASNKQLYIYLKIIFILDLINLSYLII